MGSEFPDILKQSEIYDVPAGCRICEVKISFWVYPVSIVLLSTTILPSHNIHNLYIKLAHTSIL